MSSIIATHQKVLTTGPRGETIRQQSTIHFTRTEMRAMFADGCRKTARELPSKQMEVYEGEDVVILEFNI